MWVAHSSMRFLPQNFRGSYSAKLLIRCEKSRRFKMDFLYHHAGDGLHTPAGGENFDDLVFAYFSSRFSTINLVTTIIPLSCLHIEKVLMSWTEDNSSCSFVQFKRYTPVD